MLKYKRFPTVPQILLVVSNAFDSRSKSKELYDQANLSPEKINYNNIDALIDKEILDPIRENISKELSLLLKKYIVDIYPHYIKEIVAQRNLVGLDSEQYTAVIHYYFCRELANFLKEILCSLRGPSHLELLCHAGSSVPFMFKWLEKNLPAWNNLKEESVKQKDLDFPIKKIQTWQRGEAIPELLSLHTMGTLSSDPCNHEWSRIKALLLIASSVDRICKEQKGLQIIECVKQIYFSFDMETALLETLEKTDPNFIAIQNLFNEKKHEILKLLSKENKREEDQEVVSQLLSSLKELIIEKNAENLMLHLFYALEGEFFLLTGDIDQATISFKKALENALYRAGSLQRILISNLLILSASKKNTPDLVLFKEMKNLAISFEMDMPIDPYNTDKKRFSFEAVAEEWEINAYKQEYARLVDKKLLFPNAYYPETTLALPVVDVTKYKPDYQNPDRRIQVGSERNLIYPQLCWFIMNNNVSVVKKLLRLKANVNVLSSSGDTPLLLAVQHMNPTVGGHPSNDAMFKMIAKYSHDVSIVNARTAKKRLTPLMAGVETRQPDIVRKLLSMGAKPDLRGDTDLRTPLYKCLSLLGVSRKSFQKSIEDIMPNMNTSLVQDAIRRYGGAHIFGPTLNAQSKGIEGFSKTERHQKIGQELIEHCQKQYNYDEKNLLQIAELLLEAGADPNAENSMAIPNYTPLLLACELDLGDLVKKMLDSYGGDSDTTVYIDAQKRNFRLYDIAQGHRALSVIKVLEERMIIG